MTSTISEVSSVRITLISSSSSPSIEVSPSSRWSEGLGSRASSIASAALIGVAAAGLMRNPAHKDKGRITMAGLRLNTRTHPWFTTSPVTRHVSNISTNSVRRSSCQRVSQLRPIQLSSGGAITTVPARLPPHQLNACPCWLQLRSSGSTSEAIRVLTSEHSAVKAIKANRLPTEANRSCRRIQRGASQATTPTPQQRPRATTSAGPGRKLPWPRLSRAVPSSATGTAQKPTRRARASTRPDGSQMSAIVWSSGQPWLLRVARIA